MLFSFVKRGNITTRTDHLYHFSRDGTSVSLSLLLFGMRSNQKAKHIPHAFDEIPLLKCTYEMQVKII